MRLANCTCQRVNDYLKEHDSIMLVLGSTENHGRHMPLGTDTMIPDKIAELTEKQSHIMIAPTLPYGATDSLMGFPGTISIGVDGLYDILTRITDSLYEYGFPPLYNTERPRRQFKKHRDAGKAHAPSRGICCVP